MDRTTRETKIIALPNRKADKVSDSCITMLRGEHAYSITFDNGKEFSQHETIANWGLMDKRMLLSHPFS